MGQDSRSDLLFLLKLAMLERYDEQPLLWGGSSPSSKTSDILSLCLHLLLDGSSGSHAGSSGASCA